MKNRPVSELDLAFWTFLLATEGWAIAFYLEPGGFPLAAGAANLLLAIFFAMRSSTQSTKEQEDSPK